ncbi:MAG TPA: transporter substrate-binding domain-containing protein [Patescibacteria group bacterium]|nr:transporter substrate-binding domain-containing protein [Patescibacteria group bacterium]
MLAVLALAIISTMSSCGGPKKTNLIVGVNTDFPPFEVRNGEDITGFDIDLANLIAKKTGRHLVVRDYSEFDSLLPTLKAGKLDMVISAVTIRKDREEVASFSSPYFEASQALLTTQSANLTWSGKASDLAGKRVGYQKGTTSESWVKDNLLDGKVNIESATAIDDLSIGLLSLNLKSLDVIIIDAPVAESYAGSHKDLRVAGKIDTGEQYGVVVAKNDPQKLLPTVNSALKTLRDKNGKTNTTQYDQLVQRWFGGAK